MFLVPRAVLVMALRWHKLPYREDLGWFSPQMAYISSGPRMVPSTRPSVT